MAGNTTHIYDRIDGIFKQEISTQRNMAAPTEAAP